MSDVFISYRRDDFGFAENLSTALEERFDVFFDTDDIDYGDVFPDRIADALAECRVALVVIGPGWRLPANMKRLFDPKDWVRTEIDKLLRRRPPIRVIPVVLHTAKLPADHELPVELRALVQRNDLIITAQNVRQLRADLIERMERWLRDTLPSSSCRRGLSAYLACLCDRLNQEESLVDLVSATGPRGRAHVCVVHGHVDEELDAFSDRVRQERLLEEKDMFDARDVGLATCALQWNRDKAKAGQHMDVLRRALKAGALQRVAAKDADLDEYLAALAQPLVAWMQVTWSDCAYCGGDLVARFIEAWGKLFPPTPDAKSKPALLWINLTYDTDEQAIEDADPLVRAALLPRLSSVGYGDIMDWAKLPEVKRVNFDFLDALRPLTSHPDAHAVPARLRMKRFVDAVRGIDAPTP